MGAQSFREEVWGESAASAFDSAVARAKYLHGHGGYTGTIAEKRDFRLFHPPHGMQAETFITYIEQYSEETKSVWTETTLADSVLYAVEEAHRLWRDKWGPAVCVPTGRTTEQHQQYIFIGFASS